MPFNDDEPSPDERFRGIGVAAAGGGQQGQPERAGDETEAVHAISFRWRGMVLESCGQGQRVTKRIVTE